ncbi:hypothetical protein OBV_18930 [Oscillibacter valericigenes Sjm18-20]|nr:hypothetical protein OBV_18930 [Oscillibacter valericigenes Sjm18-20]
MNYIEEELRLQAAAFAALLGGGTDREEDTAETAGDRERTQTAEGGGNGVLRVCSAAQRLKRDPTGKMAEWNQMLRRRSAQSFRQAANALGLTETELETSAAGSNQAERTDSEGTDTRQMSRDENHAPARRPETGGGEDTVHRLGKTAGLSGAQTNFGDSAQTVFVVDGGVSAEELSRTFQRDARRYDGGYPLY